MGHESTTEATVIVDENQDLFEAFLQQGTPNPGSIAQINYIGHYCGTLTLRALKEALSATSERKALVFAPGRSGTASHLTAQELCDFLSSHCQVPLIRPLYLDPNAKAFVDNLPGVAIKDCCQGLDQAKTISPTEPPRIDSESSPNAHSSSSNAHIIYVADIDSLFAGVLVATVPSQSAKALRLALQRHFSSSVNADLHLSQQDFYLSLHVPVVLWRTSWHPKQDDRQDRGGRPLRKVSDVTQFDRDSDVPSYLYQGHYTCAISGRLESTWTAYCFDDYGPDSGGHYEQVSDISSVPEAMCHRQTNDVPEDPRIYFIRVCIARLDVLIEEWECVIGHLELSIRKNYDTDTRLSERAAFDWLDNAEHLLLMLKMDLQQTRHAFDRLVDIKSCSEDFQDVVEQHLSPNARRLRELADFSLRMDVLAEIVKVAASKLGKCTASEQRMLAAERGQMTPLILLCSPVVLTSGLFSMRDGVLVPTSTVSFFVVLGVCTGSVLALAWILRIVPLPTDLLVSCVNFALQYWETVYSHDLHEIIDIMCFPRKNSSKKRENPRHTDLEDGLESHTPYAKLATSDFPSQPTRGVSEPDRTGSVPEPLDDRQLTQPAHQASGVRSRGYSQPPSHDPRPIPIACASPELKSRFRTPVETGAKTAIPYMEADTDQRQSRQTLLPLSESSGSMSLRPTFNLQTGWIHQSRHTAQVAMAVAEYQARQHGPGEFICLCLGDNTRAQLQEIDAQGLRSDDDFARVLYEHCDRRWGWFLRLITMSTCDQVMLKEFHFMSSGSRVRCSPLSSLPGDLTYKHHGPADVHCREDIISHDFQRYINSRWRTGSVVEDIEAPHTSRDRVVLDAIPKKHPWRLEYSKGYQGWGLQVRLRFCYWRLLACIAIWAIDSGVFVGVWLWRHDGDLQGAWIVPTVMLALLTAYTGWMWQARA